MDQLRTFDSTAAALAFPLGGIGTGNISLGARGDLRDWEIFNRPAKGQMLPNAFFAIRTETADGTTLARVLEGPIQPPYTLSHGYHPSTAAGLPRLKNTRFTGEYPFATIEFEDDTLPVQVRLRAYTPLVPLNPEDSGIPCAILEYTVTNPTSAPVNLTLVGSLANPAGGLDNDEYGNIRPNRSGRTRNSYRDEGNLHGLFMDVVELDTSDLLYGSLSLVTDHPQITVKPAWLRGGWYDFLREFWDDFTIDGRLDDLGYDTPSPDGRPDTGSLGLVDTLSPGASQTYRFVLTWHFPNRVNSWTPNTTGKTIRNHYATRFADAWAVATYTHEHLARLHGMTQAFHDALFGSTLPPVVLDALSANIVPVRSNTCFWLEDGRFYGWEGCFDDAGCCAGSCTHVWSYVQTVAFLFPSLEREMRRIEFEVETEADGYMYFRNFRSMQEEFLWAWGEQKPEAAVDGQMGSILRVYREWQLCGDRNWLASLWPAVKAAIDYASAHWDTDGDHVLDGRQHNTYDIEFYGPNPLCGIYYLAALRAVEEMARIMDEPELAERCHTAFTSGSANLDQMLWNGDYYVQRLTDINAYKYQHGAGCLSDQLLGQLHARILGLGDLLPREHIRHAARAIFQHNYRTSFTDHTNYQRTYVLNDEAGLILCTWPHGERPDYPFVYSDEAWTSIEYHVAALLIYEGWLEEALTLIRAARERHDGHRRNPWNEVECGHHYARTMSIWAVLLALSGAHSDLGQGILSFDPVLAAGTEADTFRTFFSTGQAWGIYTQRRHPETGQWHPEIEVLGGDLEKLQLHACGQVITFG